MDMEHPQWKSPIRRTIEDDLLLRYWQQVGGVIFAEVIVGRGGLRRYPLGAQRRSIDAVRIIQSETIHKPEIITFRKYQNGSLFENMVKNAHIEIIELKQYLDRAVIGQAIVGAELLRMEYSPSLIHKVIIYPSSELEPLLEIVCQSLEIRTKRI